MVAGDSKEAGCIDDEKLTTADKTFQDLLTNCAGKMQNTKEVRSLIFGKNSEAAGCTDEGLCKIKWQGKLQRILEEVGGEEVRCAVCRLLAKDPQRYKSLTSLLDQSNCGILEHKALSSGVYKGKLKDQRPKDATGTREQAQLVDTIEVSENLVKKRIAEAGDTKRFKPTGNAQGKALADSLKVCEQHLEETVLPPHNAAYKGAEVEKRQTKRVIFSFRKRFQDRVGRLSEEVRETFGLMDDQGVKEPAASDEEGEHKIGEQAEPLQTSGSLKRGPERQIIEEQELQMVEKQILQKAAEITESSDKEDELEEGEIIDFEYETRSQLEAGTAEAAGDVIGSKQKRSEEATDVGYNPKRQKTESALQISQKTSECAEHSDGSPRVALVALSEGQSLAGQSGEKETTEEEKEKHDQQKDAAMRTEYWQYYFRKEAAFWQGQHNCELKQRELLEEELCARKAELRKIQAGMMRTHDFYREEVAQLRGQVDTESEQRKALEEQLRSARAACAQEAKLREKAEEKNGKATKLLKEGARELDGLRVRVQEREREAQALRIILQWRDGKKEMKEKDDAPKNGQECACCFEPWDKRTRRGAVECGHADFCTSCIHEYFQKDFSVVRSKGKRNAYKCPFGCDLRSKKVVELFL